MSTVPAMPPSAAYQKPRVPPVHPGDRLTRIEFERRYAATPGAGKAELIEGIVFMPPPPVSDELHGDPHFMIVGCLALYAAATPVVRGSDNSSLRLDLDNMPQPDACLRIAEPFGGQSRREADGFIAGAPEFVAEVSATSASYDLHSKLEVYRRHGVREYVVWRTFDREFDHFTLVEGRFDPVPQSNDGILRSLVLPGLWLDTKALSKGDLPAALATVQRGTSSPEHADFLKRRRAGT